MNISSEFNDSISIQHQDEEPPLSSYWQHKMYTGSILYVSPILIVAGTLCNILSFIVLQTKVYRGSSTGFLLSVLSISDIGVLNTGLMRLWITALLNDDIRLSSSVSCRVHIFSTYLFGHLSAWTLTLVTIERVVCVCSPFKCKEVCSLRRMVGGWFALMLTLTAINSHFFWTVSVITFEDYTRCTALPQFYNFVQRVFQWMDLFLVCFGPFAVILVGNIIIVVKIISTHAQRKRNLHASGKTSSTTSTTVMLIVVSIMFLLMTSPSTVYFVGSAYGYWPWATRADTAKVYGAYGLCYLLYYTNSTINFFLYCASGNKFRRALVTLFSHFNKARDPQPSTTQRTDGRMRGTKL